MPVNLEIQKAFLKLLVNSLNADQVNHLGELLSPEFNARRESGFSRSIPLPAQTAAETLLEYYAEEDDIVRLFAILLESEGTRFYNAPLRIWERDRFILLLIRHKWMFDPELGFFFRDPFYEHEINILKKLRVVDLRNEVDVKAIIADITAAASTLSIRDLEWRITIRLYDMDGPSVGLVRTIIDLLLVRQDLGRYSYELFTCLKELAVNASKANYKLLFEKHAARPHGASSERDYREFMRLFKKEIEENGNRNLIEFARQEDRFITITFQSSLEAISIWVANNAVITTLEKKRLLKKLRQGELAGDSFETADDDFAEGAGMGISLVLSILKRHSRDREPLKVVFYPDFIKIGFELKRTELSAERDALANHPAVSADARADTTGDRVPEEADQGGGTGKKGSPDDGAGPGRAIAMGARKKKPVPKKAGTRGAAGKRNVAKKKGAKPAKKKTAKKTKPSASVKKKK